MCAQQGGLPLLLFSMLTFIANAQLVEVPSQYLYTPDKAIHRETINGCTLTQWGGMDMGGMAGYPWMSTITCEDNKSFTDAGINMHGHLRFYLYRGSMEVNNRTVDVIGGAYWVDMGKRVNLKVSGSVYIVGAHFKLIDMPQVTLGSLFTFVFPTLILTYGSTAFDRRLSSPPLTTQRTNGCMM